MQVDDAGLQTRSFIAMKLIFMSGFVNKPNYRFWTENLQQIERQIQVHAS